MGIRRLLCRVTIVTMAVLGVVVTDAQAVPIDVRRSIHKRAKVEWPNDYEMQAYTIKTQIQAYKDVDQTKYSDGVPSGVFKKIKQRAKAEWPNDYEMQVYTIKKQTQAYKDAAQAKSDNEVSPAVSDKSKKRSQSKSSGSYKGVRVSLTKPYPKSYKNAHTDKISIQYAVMELARQAGYGYDWGASYKNTNPKCRRYVRPNIKDKLLPEALVELLTPVGLGYEMHGEEIVLTTTVVTAPRPVREKDIVIPPVLERRPEKRVARKVPAPRNQGVTWAEIDAIYNLQSKYTELQKNEHWKVYKGKRVRWTGKVSSVGKTFGTLYLQVKMNPTTFTSDVLVRLDATERSKALKLRKDDQVTFIGTLNDWGSLMPVTLKHGEIIE